MIVAGVGPAAAPLLPRRADAGAAFRVGPPACEAASAAPVAAPDGVLALQEADAEPVRDRAARRRAALMLDELAALQRALLAGAQASGCLARLAALADARADAGAEAADPALRAAAEAVVLRARIELARAERAR